MRFTWAAWIAVPILVLVIVLMALQTSACPTAVLSTDSDTSLLNLINNYRAENGQDRLALDTRLEAAAMWMALDMADNGYASHTDSLGRYTGVRLASFGYTAYPWGEVIGLGQSSADVVLRMWKESPSHSQALLSANYQTVGIAFIDSESSRNRWYWVVDLGTLPPTPVPAPIPTPVLTPRPTPTATPDPCDL